MDLAGKNQRRICAYYSNMKKMLKQSNQKRNSTQWISYTVMHGNKSVATIRRDGTCHILLKKMMPYNLYLESVEENDIDTRVQNLENFYHWCASRVLTLDRQYAKEILNSIGMTQATTDRDRANIALSYHCLSLMDIYWVQSEEEMLSYEDINLYDNHLAKAFVDVTLRGKQMSVENSHLIADDLGTPGYYPKAWIRREDGFWLMKGGGSEFVENELLASKICRCFQVDQVLYEENYYDGQKVSESKIITSPEKSIVAMEHFEIYAMNHGIDRMEFVLHLDAYSYYMMNILDYLIGNTDRHWGNWGVLVDNETNEPIRLYALMDFNMAFHAYDTLDGAKCLTTGKSQSQKEAALEAVEKIGLNQICEISSEWFTDEKHREMFFTRLSILREFLQHSVEKKCIKG